MTKSLTADEMAAQIAAIMEGRVPPDDIATFLTALSQRGETAAEITGAARAMRAKALRINAPANAVDCCGTGGDGAHTYNISTAVALVAAACGIPVAKHGNRAATSKCGAADVLEKLGVNLDITIEQTEEALRRYNFAFLLASRHHEAMKHVAPIRKQLGFRTIFNLLGPLASPAGTKRQLVGVYDRKWLVPIATALRDLGAERALVVCGSDGLDEITVTGPTYIAALEDGVINEGILTPANFDISPRRPEELTGGDATTNAKALTDLLNGKPTAYRDIVLANTAAVLALGGRDGTLLDNVDIAAEAIDSGAAFAILDKYREFSHGRS